MKLALEALQANEGDCLLLRYGGGGKETRILIDGGSRGIYKSVLKPRLDALAGGAPLDLSMVMVSHIDSDHITGIQDLLRDLVNRHNSGEDVPYRIRTVWHNSFQKLTGGRAAGAESAAVAASLEGAPVGGLTPEVEAVVASVAQGNDVRNYATQLAIPINLGAGDDLVRAPEEGVRTVPIVRGLKFTILGPGDAELKKLDKSWHDSKTRAADPQAQAADYLNRTVPNLSSIVVLAEADLGGGKTKRLLMAADAGGDLIWSAVESAGLARDGRFEVDLLKIQHHGSNHSVAPDFFEKVIAPRYVISGNGQHGIPSRDTLDWLSAARKGEAYDAFFTNRIGQQGLKEMLDDFLEQEARAQPQHRYHFREENAPSIVITLDG